MTLNDDVDTSLKEIPLVQLQDITLMMQSRKQTFLIVSNDK